MKQLATIDEVKLFMAQLLPHAIKAPWVDHPVDSQVLADLCLEKGILLPKLHPSYYNNPREVKHYLEFQLDKIFQEGPEYVSRNIMIRREFLPSHSSAGAMFLKPFYSFKRVKKQRRKNSL